jgi:allantoinase
MSRWAIRSRRVLAPGGLGAAVVEVVDGALAALHPFDSPPAGVPLEDVGSLVVGPGVVDTHVHVNEPGRTEWEGFASATRAAAAGGVTTLVDMPLNSIPATLDERSLREKRAAAEGRCAVDVGFLGGVVPGNADRLAGLHEAGVLGFKCFLVPSGVDEFPASAEADVARALAVLAPLDALLMVHAELPGPLAAARAPAHTRSYAAYAASRPAAAETEAVALVVRLAEAHRARVHVVHLSSAASLPLLAAGRSRGARVSAETCPHYLHFAAGEIPDGATEYKCAPPIRDHEEREALWRALASGAIGHVASDHSPCPPALRRRDSGDFMAAWGGVASLQLTLPVLWTGMRARGLPLERLGEWLSAAPARLLGLDRHKGALEPGRDADLVVWDPEASFSVEASALLQRHPLTPYLGARFHGVVHATFVRGRRVFSRERGVDGGHGRLLHPGRIAA